MTHRTLVTLAAACGLAAFVSTGWAASTLSAAIGQLEQKGYVIIELEEDDDRADTIEVKAMRADGRKVEMLVETSTGRIIREKLDD